MQQLINKTWLWLAFLALGIAIYVTLAEGFIFGKAYMFLLMGIASLLLYKFKKNLGS